MYEQGLKEINDKIKKYQLTSLQHYDDVVTSSGHLFLMRVQGADEVLRGHIIEGMAQRGVAANVHYKPLPLLTAYQDLGFDISGYPNAYAMFCNEISLPLHTKLADEDVRYILDCLEEVLVCEEMGETAR